jgi:23S rRNA (cytidine1920-2'-O)/16S rRNA (cytidine1409-2'-O)-methyltransferase
MMPMKNSLRLDKALVERNIVTSRTRAQAVIGEGKVSLNGKVVTDPDHTVKEEDTIALLQPDFPWVSRGGLKLLHAIDHWHIDLGGKIALDIGASTGGFTDVLLERGVAKVYALDVGHGQLALKLKNDPRVVNMEGIHISDVMQENFDEPIDIITIDVSFISITKVLPQAKALLSQGGFVIALIKPQFEVGKKDIGKGVVKDAALHERVLREVTDAAQGLGMEVVETITSPIMGGDGNKEFLMLLKKAGQRS